MRTKLLFLSLILWGQYASAQFVFKDEREAVKGLQYAYLAGSGLYASGKDISAVYTLGVGIETGITYAIIKNLHVTPRGYIHYFANYPSNYNYNDNLWLWNLGGTVSYKIPLGSSDFSMSPLVSLGYKGGVNVISFPYSNAENFKLMKLNGFEIAPGLMIESSSYFFRFSYEIYQNKYELNEGFIPNNPPKNIMSIYGPLYVPAYKVLDMNYINFTIGYKFDFFQ